MFSNRVFVGQEHSRKPIANDDGSRLFEPLSIAKRAAAHERDLHCREVAGVSKAFDGQQDASWWQGRMLGNYERIITPVAMSRRHTHHPGFLDARQAAHGIDNLPKECRSLLLEILWLGQIDTHGQSILNAAAQVRRAQALVALQQQPRSHEQHHSESDFKGQKNLAQSRSTLAASEGTRGILKAFENSRASGAESRKESS